MWKFTRRLAPVAYVWPARLFVHGPGGEGGEGGRLVWCSRHVVVAWHRVWRLTAWRVGGVAWSVRLGRLEAQWLA